MKKETVAKRGDHVRNLLQHVLSIYYTPILLPGMPYWKSYNEWNCRLGNLHMRELRVFSSKEALVFVFI